MSASIPSRSKPHLLADENFPRKAIEKLRRLGYDIKSIAEIKAGLSNGAVAKLAREENRILLTFDKDFGEMMARNRPKGFITVILYRLTSFDEKQLVEITMNILDKENITHHFVVVQENQIRIIPL